MAAKKNVVAAKKEASAGTALVTGGKMNFMADSGKGKEGTSVDSFAIPFLTALQKGSPQVDEAGGKVLKGAKAGMLFNTVSQKLWDGKEGVFIVPVAYKRAFIRWGARDNGGGFKGEFTPEAAAKMRQDEIVLESEGTLYYPSSKGAAFNKKKDDVLMDHRNHYVLIVDADDPTMATRALMSLKSTQIKKSKMLMSALDELKIGEPGAKFNPPTFANLIQVTTQPEQNDSGSWFGYVFTLEGQLDESQAAIYEMAKEFHASSVRGEVKANYADIAGEQQAGDGGAGGKF